MHIFFLLTFVFISLKDSFSGADKETDCCFSYDLGSV